MLELSKISGDVLSCIEENCKNPELCSVEEAFDHYLTWQGVCGYTRDFIEAYEEIKSADRATSMKLDLLDKCWEVVLTVLPNPTYAQVLAATGRFEELNVYLQEYISRQKQGS
jgi:hypothetical protein